MQLVRKPFCRSLRGSMKSSPVSLLVLELPWTSGSVEKSSSLLSSKIGLRIGSSASEGEVRALASEAVGFFVGGTTVLVVRMFVLIVVCEGSFYSERLCRTPVFGKMRSLVVCSSNTNFDVCRVGYLWLRRGLVCVVVVACSCVYLGAMTLDTANTNTLNSSTIFVPMYHCRADQADDRHIEFRKVRYTLTIRSDWPKLSILAIGYFKSNRSIVLKII